jgi:hypothetical protein
MAGAPTGNSQLPTILYATLMGAVDQAMVQRVFQGISSAINGGVKSKHVLNLRILTAS